MHKNETIIPVENYSLLDLFYLYKSDASIKSISKSTPGNKMSGRTLTAETSITLSNKYKILSMFYTGFSYAASGVIIGNTIKVQYTLQMEPSQLYFVKIDYSVTATSSISTSLFSLDFYVYYI